jgi:hypothetical protein
MIGPPVAGTRSEASKAFVGVLAVVFALVGWYPFGAGSVAAVGMGLWAARVERTDGPRWPRVVGLCAAGLGALTFWIAPTYAMVHVVGCDSPMFVQNRAADVTLVLLTLAAPAAVMSAVVWAAARRSWSQAARWGLVGVLSAAEVAAFVWAFFAFFIAVMGECF